jgi:hypothetical protein
MPTQLPAHCWLISQEKRIDRILGKMHYKILFFSAALQLRRPGMQYAQNHQRSSPCDTPSQVQQRERRQIQPEHLTVKKSQLAKTAQEWAQKHCAYS